MTAVAASAGTSTKTVVTAADVGAGKQWHLEDTDTGSGTYSFVNGPNVPPGGSGSMQMTINEGNHEWVNNYAYGVCKDGPACTTPAANWTKLSDITALGYSTFRVSGSVPITLNLEVDVTGTGSGYATFVFVPNAVANGVWQNWDALNPAQGSFFSSKNITTPPGGPFACAPQSAGCTHTWSDIVAGYPNALIKLGIGPNLGTGGTYVGNVDNMIVGVSGNTTTYDFEVNPPTTTPTAPPAAKPGAPRPVVAVPGNNKAVVSWKAPANTGGSPITGYVVTPYVGSTAQPAHVFTSTATKQGIANLQNKAMYRFAVAAQTAAGVGPAALSGMITVGAPGQPGPAKVTAAGGVLKVAFKPPANNGAKISHFTATCVSVNGGVTRTRTGLRTPVGVKGATAGKAYRCWVTATNRRGTGPRSVSSPLVKA